MVDMKKKIIFVISSLRGGGAERVIVNLANYYSIRNISVSLITFDDPKLGEVYHLNPKVERQILYFPPGKYFFQNPLTQIRRLFRLRYLIKRERPDVVVSFMTPINIFAIISCIGIQTRCIVSERIDPREFNYGLRYNLLRRLLYPFATRVAVQTDEISEWFMSHGYKNLSVIPNCVWNTPDIQCDSPSNCVLAIGRLNKQKGFEVLIRSFARLAPMFPDWKLLILGEGEERNSLEDLITSLAMNTYVKLMGWVGEPTKYLLTAAIYAQPSRYEGFPNALLEAMACGLPAISTHQAAYMLIKDGVNGLLVSADDVDQLTSALKRLMESPELRTNVGRNALKVLETYGQERVMDLWDKTLFTD
jgi:GalNAc-alpha-(1->4)-GalNAc-alpha-(1->3)-diNAcBac-PP-undecaprenol alpha-1,4-N-acetyl-D-galactosaminyltransferase